MANGTILDDTLVAYAGTLSLPAVDPNAAAGSKNVRLLASDIAGTPTVGVSPIVVNAGTVSLTGCPYEFGTIPLMDDVEAVKYNGLSYMLTLNQQLPAHITGAKFFIGFADGGTIDSDATLNAAVVINGVAVTGMETIAILSTPTLVVSAAGGNAAPAASVVGVYFSGGSGTIGLGAALTIYGTLD